MKRVISVVAAITLMVICFSTGIVAHSQAQEVTLSAGGSLSDALAQVADNGTIVVDGTVAVTTALGNHGKTVTITGGTLDFTGYEGDVSLGDHITFENITMTFSADASPVPAIFANGYKVKFGEGVTMPNPIRLFGGRSSGLTASTHLTVLSGYYTGIYGGGNNTNIYGDVYLYVGGNVNKSVNTSSHTHNYCIYGGNYMPAGSVKTIGGSTTLIFADNAKATYIFGGSHGAGDCIVKGSIDVTVSGGNALAVYGTTCGNGDIMGDVNVLVCGGRMEQVFGGGEGGAVTGNVSVDITGGTITRRVYGGCYNDYDGSWVSSHYVTGNVMLTLHSGANINFSSSSLDRAIYAHSRQRTLSDTEVTHLVFADATAYNNYKDKLKAQDSTMKSIMGNISAADHIHYHTYTASGAILTQNCIDSSCSATATLVVEDAPVYNGVPVEPAKVVYTGDWFGGELDVSYDKNDKCGTATASITYGGATAKLPFHIVDPSLSVNGVGYASLEDAIIAARATEGADTITLLRDVEISDRLVINTDVTITADKAVTITAADSQTGGMLRIIDGTFTVEGASEDAKITIAAGKSTTHIVSNKGGNVVLTNVALVGNENTSHTGNNKTHGIFNDKGAVTAKSVDITDISKGDGICVMDGTTVNLDNVTIDRSGRYGIKVKGTLNIFNTVHSDHALSISGSTDHAIDVENGGKVVCDFDNASAVKFFENMRKDLNVRKGGDATLSYASREN